MIAGELKNKVDQVWNVFWSGGISNPLSVIEQITYLLFIKRLDEIQTQRESKAHFAGGKVADPIFEKNNEKDEHELRWSRFPWRIVTRREISTSTSFRSSLPPA